MTFLVGDLIDNFPKSNYILIVRDPRSNIRSILDRYMIPGNLQENPEIIKNLSLRRGWKEVFDGSLMKTVEMHYIDLLAERWRIAATIPHRYSDIDIPIIRYEDFVKEKVKTISKLAQGLGMEGYADIKNYTDRQFQPKGKRRNMSWIEFYGKENIRRIEKKCLHIMEEYNYKSMTE